MHSNWHPLVLEGSRMFARRRPEVGVIHLVACVLLLYIACMSLSKWLTRRQAGTHAPWSTGNSYFRIWEHATLIGLILETAMYLLFYVLAAPVALSFSFGTRHQTLVVVDMIRVPDWAFEATGQELRSMGQDAAVHHPGLYLTPTQREAVEALIQELPQFGLKAVPTDCSDCPICLEEFHVGNEVRDLPCAHSFHVECIDEWLRLNVKCPQCRCSVFPNLDLSASSNLRPDPEQLSPTTVVTTGANLPARTISCDCKVYSDTFDQKAVVRQMAVMFRWKPLKMGWPLLLTTLHINVLSRVSNKIWYHSLPPLA